VGAAVAELPDGWAESVLPFAVALAGTAVEADDLDLATQLVRPQVRDHPGLLAIRRIHQALQTLHDDQPALALDHLIDCGRQLDRMGWTNPALFPWRGWVATLRHRLGQTSAAITLAEEELEMARSWAAPTAVGRSLRVLGSITAGPAGVKLLREAVTVIAGSTNELQRARAHLALAYGLGDHPEAAKHRQLAARLANLCGVPRLVRMVDHPADHLPARTAAVLTRSEQRVVRLAAEGWTNQAIADELGVSCRAVEKHLTSSYRKLGVRGRSGLTAV
jgi:DNA-binding CsgD family transcriptional regulator